ncbi:uncharacterized protein LOC122040843 isoform X1 [Zingiber officinale]|uniref:Uncharacterized protein n=1 Tax=Zingiber officinale TaxID=94328 RepID=A0A8J5I3R1_ZINOF|nr:uncharacterized protein LOC122040843 isoform X1 [Zingiber officinale]KAG6527380.1 hypothetical protein ZIOFF_009479 [Zingiber officinale]
MANRQLSSTLKNLKFMQRASLKDDKVKEVDKDKPLANFDVVPAPAGRCIVIMEGDPHPGALKGRMSFQSFNPSIDKLNEEAANNQQNVATASNSYGDSSRVGEATAIGSREPRIGRSNNGSDVGLKRKQPEVDSNSTTPEEMLKIYSDQGKQSSSNNRTGSLKQQKRGKLDWNVLRPTTI